MYQFDQDTSLEVVAENRFSGTISNRWNIGNNPNGGYLASVALQGLTHEELHTDPLSVTVHYLRPGIANANCEVHTQTTRVGRTLRNARATLIQQSKPRLELMAVLGDLGAQMGVTQCVHMEPPSLPAPDACVPRSGTAQGIDLSILGRLEVLLNPTQAVPGVGSSACVSGWIRFADGREPDAAALLQFADAFPPSPFPLLGVVGWVPTVELTVQVLRVPAPGWIRAEFKTDSLQQGRMIETGALWDSNGELVAQSRQFGLVLEA